MEPVLITLSTQDADLYSVFKVDCTVNTATCRAFHVRGYPTLWLVKQDQAARFEGSRSIAAIHAFASSSLADLQASPDYFVLPNPLYSAAPSTSSATAVATPPSVDDGKTTAKGVPPGGSTDNGSTVAALVKLGYFCLGLIFGLVGAICAYTILKIKSHNDAADGKIV